MTNSKPNVRAKRRKNRNYQIATVLVLVVFVVAVVLYLQGGRKITTEEHLQRAVAFERSGDLRAAIIEFKNVLQKEPERVAARLSLGKLYLETGDSDSAQKEFNKAKRQGADDPELPALLLRTQLLQREYEQVLGALVTNEEISDFDHWLLRGEAQLGLNRLAAARASFQKALELDPTSVVARRRLAQAALVADDPAEAKRLIDELLTGTTEDTEALVMKGELEYLSRNLPESRAAFETALASSEDHLLARHGLTRTLLAQGETEAAQPHIEEIIKASPNSPTGYFYQALAAQQQENIEATRDALGKVLRIAPDHPMSLLLSGALNYQTGDVNQAEAQLTQYMQLVPDSARGAKILSTIYMNRGELERAIEYLESFAEQNSRDAELMALIGTAYMGAGNFDQANDYLELAASLEPDARAVRVQLAMSRLSNGEPDEAVLGLKSVMELDPDYELGEYLLMYAHLNNNDYANALATGERLASSNPNNPVPLNLMGRVYEQQGKLNLARGQYEQALSLKPDYVTASLNLGRLEMRDDVSAAKARYQGVLETDPANTQALEALAAIAKQEGRTREAITFLETARAADPNTLSARVYLMIEYLAAADFEHAHPVLAEARAIAPENPQVETLAGQLQLESGQPDEAITTFNAIIGKYPDVSNTYYLLGKAFSSAKRYEEAQAAWRKTLELEPLHFNAKTALGRVAFFRGRDEEAIQAARELQQQEPRLWIGWVLEADTLARQGHVETAISLYETSLEKNAPGGIAIRLASHYRVLGQTEKAHDLLRDWLETHPQDVNVHLTLAGNAQNTGNVEAALERYEHVLSFQPNNLSALNNLALLHSENKDPRGLDYAERAYQLAPTEPRIADTYGWILLSDGNLKKGLDVLEKAALLAPDNPQIQYHFATALARDGQTDTAISKLEGLLESGRPFAGRPAALEILEALR